MPQYFNGMIWIPWEYCISNNPKQALEYIKKHREPAINKVIEAMENSSIYTQFIQGIEITEIK